MICLPALKLTALLHSLQQKTLFQNFMESLLQKSSKLRSLCKDLSKNYKLDSNTWGPKPVSHALYTAGTETIKQLKHSCLKSRPRSIQTLETHIKALESEHEKLNLHMAQGEVSGFGSKNQ